MTAEVRPYPLDKFMSVFNDYFEDAWEKKRNGQKVAWCSGSSPHELLRTMDIKPVYPEGYGAVCSAMGISNELCQQAETLGYSSDLCSVVRNLIGLAYSPPEPERLPFGGLPKPDLLLCQTYCPGVYKTWEKMSRFFNVPLLVMEKARLYDSLSQEEIDYIIQDSIEELKGLITAIEGITGRNFDYSKLSHVVDFQQKASRAWLDVIEMCKNKPTPITAFDIYTHMFILYWYRGDAEAVTYYEDMRADILERVSKNIVTMVAEEKHRLYLGVNVENEKEEISQHFSSYGAVPVVASIPLVFDFTAMDPENPLKSMAEYSLFNGSNSGFKRKVDTIIKLVEDYSLDGLVMPRFRTCQLLNFDQEDIARTVSKKTGLPAVTFEGDVCDSRFFSNTEFNNKVDAFLEILNQRSQ